MLDTAAKTRADLANILQYFCRIIFYYIILCTYLYINIYTCYTCDSTKKTLHCIHVVGIHNSRKFRLKTAGGQGERL